MGSSLLRYTREEVLSDMSKLIKILTEAHPDPFLNVGSQVKFFIKVNEFLKELPETMDLSQLHTLASKIAALVGDGHTFMDPMGYHNGRFWIEFEPIDEKLIVIGVYESKYRNLIGNHLVAVNDIPLKDLLSRIIGIRGANGAYNNLIHLADALKDPCIISSLTGNGTGDMDKAIFSLMSHENNSIQRITISCSKEPPGGLMENNSLDFPISSESDISHGILENRIGYLRIDSMRKYRENYESQLKSGASESFIRELLSRQGIETNGGIEEIISVIPSASEAVIELLKAMGDKGIKDIVVDLQKNNGGNSYLSHILAYFLYGNRALEVDMGYDIERYSTWYRHQFNVMGNVDPFNEYNFQEMDKWLSGKRGMNLKEWEDIVILSPTFTNYLKSYNPASGLRVYVLCSARTFSAGFDLLSILKKCGATVIGISPSQAANAFTNPIRFSLDISGLKGWVSSKLMLKYPDEPLFFDIKPDISIGVENFKEHKWDSNTILMETKELILSR